MKGGIDLYNKYGYFKEKIKSLTLSEIEAIKKLNNINLELATIIEKLI